MKRTITAVAVCAGLVFSGASVAVAGEDGKNDVAKACADLKKADKAAFVATYGEHAMRTCKKGEKLKAVKTTPGEFKNASKACRAERDADPVAFVATHGSNKNGKNAFGKCVSSMVGDDDGGGDDGEDDDGDGEDDGSEDDGGEDEGGEDETPIP